MNAEQNNVIKYPKTLVEAVRYFADPAVTLAFFTKLRWPEQVCCPHCGSTNVLFMAKYSRWKCREGHARPQFTVKVGTIMEDSPLSLDKWAVAFWLEVNAKNSISSYELHRALGITQKSAWFMLHRIRLAVQENSIVKLGGPGSPGVEVDETYIGGLARNMHRSKRAGLTGTGGVDKTIVAAVLDRSVVEKKDGKKKVKRISRVAACVIPNTQQETLHAVIHKHVEPGSNIYSDAHKGYNGLNEQFIHAAIDHAEKYVDGLIHTNGLENFWSLFKRCIKGTHVSVEPFHLFRYLDSEGFRFNNRDVKDGERFVMALKGIVGKRITYKALTAAPEGAPASGSGEENGASLPN
ncbi:MAG TPA: IS1595 family transposase [Tepidisphaeraceae bacterium]|jgi:transposase-like protein